ncbi:MAG: polysaccharide deacetylase family protein [Acidobacteria bacterium]|nr:polysaccharide deacetylase family protein [Acidobacteriota bacterium]
MSVAALYTGWRRRTIYRRALAPRTRLVVLRYHSVGEPADVARYADPGLSVTPARFREQVRLLASLFRVISPDEVPRVLAEPSGNGRRAAMITFDDGYRDNHDFALPILVAEGVPATFFVTTGPLHGEIFWTSELWRISRTIPDLSGQSRREMTRVLSALPAAERDRELDRLAARARVPRGEGLAGTFMDSDHLRALHRAGMTVGAHTRSHPHLDRLPGEHAAAEVAGSRADLEAVLGAPVRHFAYPNPGGGGPVCAGARAQAEQAGFLTACTSIAGGAGADSDPLRLPRLGVYAGDQERTLFAVLEQCGG